MYVCMYACMYVCICVCLYGGMYVSMNKCTFLVSHGGVSEGYTYAIVSRESVFHVFRCVLFVNFVSPSFLIFFIRKPNYFLVYFDVCCRVYVLEFQVLISASSRINSVFPLICRTTLSSAAERFVHGTFSNERRR